MANVLIGKRVVAVWLAEDRQAIRFDTEDGETIVAYADGDCCSYSWIEDVDLPSMLLSVVRAAEEIDMPDSVSGWQGPQEYTRYYGYRITTDIGVCMIDYRNSSNGYYGGSLVWGEPYGGVYNQNKSKEVWKRLV